jgi:hypothetical protein
MVEAFQAERDLMLSYPCKGTSTTTLSAAMAALARPWLREPGPRTAAAAKWSA